MRQRAVMRRIPQRQHNQPRARVAHRRSPNATREHRDNVPPVRDNALPAVLRRHPSGTVGKHIQRSAPVRVRDLEVECQRRGDGLYRDNVPLDPVGREAAHALALRRPVGRAIRGQDSARLHDQGRARVAPVARVATVVVQQDATAQRRKRRRSDERRSLKRSQPVLLLFHRRSW
jgi:hypothetical protein